MKFSLESIHKAHQLYTGPDFPKLIREFKLMGMVTNIFNLENGEVTYINQSGDTLKDEGIKINFRIKDVADYEEVLIALKRNQKGESDFFTFCQEMAKAGIYQWISDLNGMTCTYYDKGDNKVVTETIPSI